MQPSIVQNIPCEARLDLHDRMSYDYYSDILEQARHPLRRRSNLDHTWRSKAFSLEYFLMACHTMLLVFDSHPVS